MVDFCRFRPVDYHGRGGFEERGQLFRCHYRPDAAIAVDRSRDDRSNAAIPMDSVGYDRTHAAVALVNPG